MIRFVKPIQALQDVYLPGMESNHAVTRIIVERFRKVGFVEKSRTSLGVVEETVKISRS